VPTVGPVAGHSETGTQNQERQQPGVPATRHIREIPRNDEGCRRNRGDEVEEMVSRNAVEKTHRISGHKQDGRRQQPPPDQSRPDVQSPLRDRVHTDLPERRSTVSLSCVPRLCQPWPTAESRHVFRNRDTLKNPPDSIKVWITGSILCLDRICPVLLQAAQTAWLPSEGVLPQGWGHR
jgi:hypothetical protein